MTTAKRGSRPPIHMIDTEADALADMATRASDVRDLLMREIDRATVHKAGNIPADVVTMYAQVDFIDEASGARRSVKLVYPGEADITAGRVSVLTPVGAGLIGLREGGSIVWPDRDGRERKLTVVKVTQPPRS